MSRYTEKPMARAAEHLASARYAEAAGAFRAVLRIDPNELQAHFGLADALAARGQTAEAVDGLVSAAEACSGQDDHAAALTLYGKALSIDPGRLELHLDVAMAEAALGRMEAAQSRLENLAEVYMQAGRTDEAAEVYRCLAGWEGDGEPYAAEEGEAPVEAAPAVQSRRTLVPTAPARDAVPQMVTSNETMVISTILVTPDGQLMQLPIEQHGQPRPMRTGDTVPPIPAELLEAAHSAPIDLAEGEELEQSDRTVVAFPPPPPTLPEKYESAVHTVDRAELEAAVVAAMDNLAQLEEEDMTLIMQRLPPQPKVQGPRTRTGETRLPEFIVKSKPTTSHAPARARAPEPEPETEEQAEGKLRLRPAPRPPTPKAAAAPAPKQAAPASRASGGAKADAAAARAGATKSAAKGVAPASRAGGSKPVAAPVRASGAAKPSAAPARTGAAAARPAAAPARASGAAKPSSAPARGVAAAKPAVAPARGAAKPAAAPARAGGPIVGAAARPGSPASRGPAGPAGEPASPPKATRPNNPLADRLRRRAGLPRPDAAPGHATEPRATEPITVRPAAPRNKK